MLAKKGSIQHLKYFHCALRRDNMTIVNSFSLLLMLQGATIVLVNLNICAYGYFSPNQPTNTVMLSTVFAALSQSEQHPQLS